MKLDGKETPRKLSVLAGFLCAVVSIDGIAGSMGPAALGAPGKIYFSAFGGAGASSKTDISQYGTAFFTEAAGGPLAVDAFGRSNSRTVGLVGGHVGYQWAEILENPFVSNWGLAPAFELEGYYLSKSDFKDHEINNITARLDEHDFLVNYPMSAGIFLTNAVLNFNTTNSAFQPYVGAGIGAAVISISHAQSIQVSPPEPGINHYNSNTSDNETAFAGQVKVGTIYNLSLHTSLFAEYRWLYVGPSNYTFGSTVYPGHAPTSAWIVELDSHNYNMGSLGIRYTI